MSRSGRAKGRVSRFGIVILLAVLVVAGMFWLVRPPAPPQVAAVPAKLLPDDRVPTQVAQVEQPTVAVTLSAAIESTTRPNGSQSTRGSTSPVRIDGLISRAIQLRDQGDLVTARAELNAALLSGQLTHSDLADTRDLLTDLNRQILFSRQFYKADPFNQQYEVKPGNVLRNIARQFAVTPELLMRINGIADPRRLRAGQKIKVLQGPFHAVVSKSRFTMDVYLGSPGGPGSMFITSFRVGLGSDDSTPLGTWLVTHPKQVNPTYYSPRGEGVLAPEDPKNPLGERWIPLEGIAGNAVGQDSYGIHGTIEPESIGRNMSLGCIRLMNEDVEFLYDLLVERQSKVVVVP